VAARAFRQPGVAQPRLGLEAEEAVEKARTQVAGLIGADPREIVWTSGATEFEQPRDQGCGAFLPVARQAHRDGEDEHKAVLDTTRELERQGFEVTYLDVQQDGLLDLDRFRDALRRTRSWPR